MHSCPDCGDACYCDLEDHESEAPEDCSHACKDDLGAWTEDDCA